MSLTEVFYFDRIENILFETTVKWHETDTQVNYKLCPLYAGVCYIQVKIL